jgi:hypothetical protein
MVQQNPISRFVHTIHFQFSVGCKNANDAFEFHIISPLFLLQIVYEYKGDPFTRLFFLSNNQHFLALLKLNVLTGNKMEEPWDELMGPPPTNLNGVMGGSDASHPVSRIPPSSNATAIRANSSSAPPAAMFRSTSLNQSGSAIVLPARQRSNNDDVSSTRAILRVDSTDDNTVTTNKSGGSAFDDDAAMDEGAGQYRQNVDDDDRSVDSDIGREYDARNLQHDTIRQEALRMLEVADADSNYSVHRTITGGFTAQAKSISNNQRRTKSALQALNFTAQRTKIGKRYSDFATSPSSTTTSHNRDDDEYGETTGNVVDVMGIEARSAATSASPTNKHSNWSSRYSIDSTMLAMSGGSTQSRPWAGDYTTRSTSNERLAAKNLFHSSPTSSPQVFGSGFNFRQQHVFGKQRAEKNIHADGLFNEASSTSPMSNPRLKTWQDQLIEKKRQQRRCALAILAILLCTLIPMITLLTSHKKAHNVTIESGSVSDGTNTMDEANQGTLIFYATANTPFTTDEEGQLQRNLAAIAQSNAHFSVHLGSIHDSKASPCDTTTYNRVANLIEDASPRPVFILPGEEDWNNCEDPDSAWDAWISIFELYNQRWDLTRAIDGEPITVYRQFNQLENWAFPVKGVLFIGVHVVNGHVPSKTEFQQRNRMNVQWVRGMSKKYESEVRAVVVCGNGQPGRPSNVNFFTTMSSFWSNFSLPTLYVHSVIPTSSNTYNNTQSYNYYHPFTDLQHVWAVQLEKTSENLPLRIQIGMGDEPFTIE